MAKKTSRRSAPKKAARKVDPVVAKLAAAVLAGKAYIDHVYEDMREAGMDVSQAEIPTNDPCMQKWGKFVNLVKSVTDGHDLESLAKTK